VEESREPERTARATTYRVQYGGCYGGYGGYSYAPQSYGYSPYGGGGTFSGYTPRGYVQGSFDYQPRFYGYGGPPTLYGGYGGGYAYSPGPAYYSTPQYGGYGYGGYGAPFGSTQGYGYGGGGGY
jgi:hypothetical protein